MRKITVAGTVLALALAGPAFAQNNATDSTNSSSDNAASSQHSGWQSSRHVTQQLRNDLQKNGYSDVKVMPESFLVHAQDKQGHPVMMMITPTSMTEITALGPEHTRSASNGNGSTNTASNDSSNSNNNSNSGNSGH